MAAIWNALKKLNRNQVMLLIGLAVAEGPDVAAVANFLASSGIPHLTQVVHLLGWVSTALASAALAWPRIRSKLAAVGLTTPPGAQAPWSPTANPSIVPMVQAPRAVDPDSHPDNTPAKPGSTNPDDEITKPHKPSTK